MENETLPVISAENGTKIYPIQTIDEILKVFLCKMTALYGLTASGKSYLIDTILMGLTYAVPKFLFYSKSENMNGAYSKITSKTCIFDYFDDAKFYEDTEFQNKICGYWRKSIDLDVLNLIYNKVSNDRRTIDNHFKQLDQINNGDDKSKKDIERTKGMILRDAILKHDLSSLSEDEKEIIKFFDINPCLAIIVDDFAAEIDESSKSKNKGQTFWREQSYNCRHYMITWFFMLQSVDALDTKMRRNVQTCVFTSPTEARLYFKNSSNGYDTGFQKEANYVINKLEKMGGFRMLIYCRDGTSDHKWNYMIGSPEAKPEPNCLPLKILCRECEKDKTTILTKL